MQASQELSLERGYTIGALACGTMGTAVLSAILRGVGEIGESEGGGEEEGLVLPGKFYATVHSEKSYDRLGKQFGSKVELLRSNEELVEKSDVILLGCKPFMAEKILSAIPESAYTKKKIVVSLLAGKTISFLKQLTYSKALVARAMTNTPSKIGAGMTVVSVDPAEPASSSVQTSVGWIFKQTGRCLFLDEKHQDAATALCGSGPAFLYVVTEALIEGGVRMGLPYAIAQECAAQVVAGSGQMVLESNEHPAVLKSQVCTPGGTTIGGLLVMEDNHVRSSISRAVEEAANIAASFAK
ncbi:pyrroline-5-carboxylate reductase [Sugiyamaella lignohabitans]|uniref:Pyrroline-5-carboxylate reductase n=1 Tax=Sugiyamaella lignohabitans TaxID=796027 RepID=A0A167D4Z1_9ASCO|nr:pyrroline-5-carboxylate reductase [Sugiyamaella lignohabitans]ANB12484.1 pyrroline-5-carboxylate reductase [Sugiyamaella lignohabitans]